jgi:hypothetical protein
MECISDQQSSADASECLRSRRVTAPMLPLPESALLGPVGLNIVAWFAIRLSCVLAGSAEEKAALHAWRH